MQKDQKWQTICAVIFFAVFGSWFWRPISAAKQALTFGYLPVAGTITQLAVDEENDVLEQIEYSYAYQGRRYFGTSATYYTRHSLTDIEEETGPLQKGRAVRVYLNARNPAKSVLVRGTTRMMYGGLAWCIIGGFLGLVGVLKVFIFQRSLSDWRNELDSKAKYSPGSVRLRLTPGGIETPTAVAITCFFTTFVLMFGLIEFWRFFPKAIGGEPGWLDKIGFWPKFCTVFALAAFAGTFDYFYTKNGHQYGRWDLEVDWESGEVNIPAPSAFDQSARVLVDDIVGIELRTLVSKAESDSGVPILRLNVLCESQTDTSDDLEDARPQIVAYTSAQSTDATKLRAMGIWLNDKAKLGLSIQESSAEGASFFEHMREIQSSHQTVPAEC